METQESRQNSNPNTTHNNLLSPQTGTATSSPKNSTTSPTFEVCWSLKRDGYAESSEVAVGKRLRHLASSLLEQGFEYVAEFEGVKLFRKRK